MFTIKPKAVLPTGTEIRNKAAIIFDANEPILTGAWPNTLDNDPPASQVLPLATEQTQPNFAVQWSGTDVGSGVASYAIYASVDDGAYEAWLTDVISTTATYNGLPGHEYSFFSRAMDGVGNVEEPADSPDATTFVIGGWPVYLPAVLRSPDAGKID